jgi:predicted alpha/beta hydrolase family esterase
MRYLNIPGLYNSGDDHWQTRWERIYPDRFIRVQQENWEVPVKESWVDRLDKPLKR